MVDDSSGRYSVLIPIHDNAQAALNDGELGYHEIEIDLTFGCLNTCMGMEYSLRIWNLVFTLETE